MFPEDLERWKEKYCLEKTCSEKCDVCDETRDIYVSKYSANIFANYCPACHDGRIVVAMGDYEPNRCPVCGEIVYYDDGDKENNIQCEYEMCDQKAHLHCVDDDMCESCKKWICDKHQDSTDCMECGQCGKMHDPSCIVSYGRDFTDEFGIICSPCFHGDDELIEEIKRPFGGPEHGNFVEYIEKNGRKYVALARENDDLTIMLTHLIRCSKPYETLKQILSQGVLVGGETGYFHKQYATKSVCFADLTIRGLLRHSKKFSPYGLGFIKDKIFEKGGGPAVYVNDKLLHEIAEFIPEKMRPFVNKIDLCGHDYHHEKEWRVSGDFHFSIDEVSIVYAPVNVHQELRTLFPAIPMIVDLKFIQLL